MSSFLVLRKGDNINRWRDGQVCPDVGQGIMTPGARRPGRREGKKRDERERNPALDREKGKPCTGWRKHERRALVGTVVKRARKKRA
ncbi:hypothetical protein TNCV_1041011 [Trichonephila clavipes]|nr:hypothetical protein TNCV_1041011 [Trichonephila clavipes]